MQEQEPESFIKTPLEFFGHSYDDILLGYPEKYHEELAEARAEAAKEIAEIEDRRARFLAGDPDVQNDRYVSSEAEVEISLAYARRHLTGQVNHKWYERRFRGRYGTDVDLNKYPTTIEFLNKINSWDYDPDKDPFVGELPNPQELTAYFNEAISNNAWSTVHYQAREWREYLHEGSSDRKTAEDYLAFAGNMVLQEYCRIALKLADDQLADDDFVSVKHLFTVCWPMAMRLEPFIPDEVKRAKQLLRETFLQMAARGTGSFRSHMELFGIVNLGQDRSAGLGSRAENEKVAISALMAFENVDDQEAEAIKQNLLARAKKLAEEKRWYVAIDIIELSTHAYGWDIAEFQDLIDQYAIDGVLYFTRDMSKMNEMRPYKIGKHEHYTCNAYEVDGLRRAPGISEDAYTKISEIENVREFEYDVRRFQEAPEEERDRIVVELFDKLAGASPELTQRFASPEIVERLMDMVLSENIGKISPQRVDEVIVSIIKLRNKGVLDYEQQNTALLHIGEKVLARAKDPNDYETFMRFIGYISPILRNTEQTEKPEDEAVWNFITPKQLEAFMRDITMRAYSRDADGETHTDIQWLHQQSLRFRINIRKAWGEFWDIREEY